MGGQDPVAWRERGTAGDRSEDSEKTAARRKSAAEERLARIERAIQELPKVREAKLEKDRPGVRISTTDPEARVMKMADGGYRPAYNVQLTADTASHAIVGVGVTNEGSDMAQMPPMLDDVERRHGRLPAEHLVDGGFAKKESIRDAARRGVTVYAPLMKPRKDHIDPFLPKVGDAPEVAQWRQRMGTPEAAKIYKERAATSETVNAHLRCFRGLDKFVVRGLPKVRCVVLWAVLACNLLKLVANP